MVRGPAMKMARLAPCLVVAFLCIQNGLCQDKYTDETRPYKFGFNIQGYQHRQEEKDEKGLIKGEYGFITADGYYRVTVYATDENGDFRIISMKNYYVGFPPEDPQTTPQPPSARGQAPNINSFPSQTPSRPQSSPNAVSREPEAKRGREEGRKNDPVKQTGLTGCSDCLIPTTKKPGVVGISPGRGLNPEIDVRSGGGRFDSQNQGSKKESPFGSQTPTPGRGNGRFQGSDPGNANGRDNFGGGNRKNEDANPQFPGGTRVGGRGGVGTEPQFPGGTRVGGRGGVGTEPQFPGGTRVGGRGGEEANPQYPGGVNGRRGEGANPQYPGGVGSPEGSRGPSTGGDRGSPGFDRVRPDVGTVRDGLPKGVTMDDIKALLYRFNYTVGFHGHHEDGYRNGDKEGDYFFDGRDGVERKVEYIANEFGYQPNITFIDLPEKDERRPNELTEKDYGLKGYEFKWFYKK